MTTTMTAACARYRMIPNSIAPFMLIESADGSVMARWLMNADAGRARKRMRKDDTLLSDLAARLEAYFDGEPVDFLDVPLPTTAGPFMQRCWAACRLIPAGRTQSYGELATRAGSTNAARAAGQAMRCNPLPVIIPCHRVVNAAGQLHGYAGQTDDRSRSLGVKRRLLGLEREGEPGD